MLCMKTVSSIQGVTLYIKWKCPHSNNCEMDAVLISIINGCTSVYSATVIYSIIGFRATEKFDECTGKWVSDLTQHFTATHIDDGYSRQRLNWCLYLPATFWSWWTPLTTRRTTSQKATTTRFWLTSTRPVQTSSKDWTCRRVTCSFSSARSAHFCQSWRKYLHEKDCLKPLLPQGVEGTGLAFIVFTEAIIRMPVSPLWAVLFFIMLFCLGLSTMFGSIEGVVAPLQELRVLPKTWPKEVFTGNSSLSTD